MTMQNFRNANLLSGSPVGAVDATVLLTADNQFVMTQGLSLIHLQSNNTTASNRTFTLQSGLDATMDPGGNNLLTLVFESGASTTCQLANSGNVKLTAAWEPVQWQSLVLRWNGQYWVEVGRAPASITSTSLTDGYVFVGSAANVATGVPLSGDVTIVNTGAVTIANNAVETAMIADENVTLAKLADAVMEEASGTLTQANILAMNGTPVELIAAPSAGSYHVVDEIELFHDYSTAAYADGGDVSIEYGDGTDVMAIDVAFVTGGADGRTLVKPAVYTSAADNTGFDLAAVLAQNIRVTNATGAFTAGNAANVIKWRIRYHTVTAQT